MTVLCPLHDGRCNNGASRAAAENGEYHDLPRAAFYYHDHALT
jgi:hypothetical protein